MTVDELRQAQPRIEELMTLLQPLIAERIEQKVLSLVAREDAVVRGQIQELYFFLDWPRILGMQVRDSIAPDNG